MSDPVHGPTTQEHDALGEINREHFNKQGEALFEQEWVRKLLAQLRDCLISNAEALGLAESRTKPARLLDYACGNGVVSRAWLDYFDEIRGIDISESMVEGYNQQARSAGIGEDRMRAVQGNLVGHPTAALEDPDLRDFDAVAISMALHHVADPDALLAKLVERLRPGGLLVVLEGKTGDDDSADGYSAAADHPTIARTGFSAEDMSAMMVRAGCQPGSVRIYPYKEPSYIPEEVAKVPGGLQGTFFLAAARR